MQDDCSAIAELIRIDIELRYEHGYTLDLRDYLSRFDILLDCPDKIAEIAFEDFRSRYSAGHPLSISRWSGLPGVSQKPWFQELARDASLVRAKARIAKLESSLAPDAAFESALEATGFELVYPIGEGAFSRVF